MRIESPRQLRDEQHAERRERQRERAKGQRRDLGDADLQHRPVAAPHQRQHRDRQQRARDARCGIGRVAAALMAAIARRDRQRLAVLALVQRARLRHPGVAADAAGKLGQLRVELVDVALAPARDLAVACVMPSWCSIRSSTGPMPTISFRSSGAFGPVEQRRRRVVLEVDDELAVARGLARARRRARAADGAGPRRTRAAARDCGGVARARAAQRGVLALRPLRIERARVRRERGIAGAHRRADAATGRGSDIRRSRRVGGAARHRASAAARERATPLRVARVARSRSMPARNAIGDADRQQRSGPAA